MRASENTPCPVRGVLDQVGDKWSMLVMLRVVERSPMRFSELRRAVDGISQRMLTETLRGLERNGVLTRTAYPTIPPRVDYAITPLGVSLAQVVRPLVAWAKEHRPEIAEARQRFDTRASAREGNAAAAAME